VTGHGIARIPHVPIRISWQSSERRSIALLHVRFRRFGRRIANGGEGTAERAGSDLCRKVNGKQTTELIQAAIEILEAENPMTVRQLFYRLVSNGPLERIRRGIINSSARL